MEICFSMANVMFKIKWTSIATVPDLYLATVNILTHLIARYQLPLKELCMNGTYKRCCYITVDSETAESRNGFTCYKLSFIKTQ
jgi:hypothetical protein